MQLAEAPERLLDRVRKLLAQAEDDSVTPAEAQAFTAKAAQLMAKYGAGTSVWLDVVDESQFFNDAGLDVSVDTAETTTFQRARVGAAVPVHPAGRIPAWKPGAPVRLCL